MCDTSQMKYKWVLTENKKESQFYVKKTCLSQFTPPRGELGQLTKSTDFEQLHGLQLLGTAIIFLEKY